MDALLDDLSRETAPTRNFYWYGHGKASWLGLEPNVNIHAGVVASRLGNGPMKIPAPGPVPIIIKYWEHPYRFVLIDGCDAGKSATWAEAFGIPGKQVSYKSLRNHPERAQAFLGFTEEIFNSNEAQAFDNYRLTLLVFSRLWMEGDQRLSHCFDVAGTKLKLHRRLVELGYNIPLLETWAMGRPARERPQKLDWTKVHRIYGYPHITRDRLLEPP